MNWRGGDKGYWKESRPDNPENQLRQLLKFLPTGAARSGEFSPEMFIYSRLDACHEIIYRSINPPALRLQPEAK
ncbi:hypothetical protein A2154_01470 [Candidatus Gottesmanbacteria bacterium RBG_16_43_7]|uniref:Uncharacterized protein n=1 Tax=Candidatus Gottesmanbacteria bacterium RBG_16_43_7 TaxID=1798373 RepID=A0A1F5ZAS1_9BACT|nr:MAG: hypothetical protein A2154_01470 [Candidatus Gottesmanbacteria bacterium RBG_16_43_7]